MNPSFVEKVREFGASLAHQALDSVTELASVVPQLQQEIVDLGKDFFSGDTTLEEIKPRKNYEAFVSVGHQKIDEVFATDQSGRYTPEAKVLRDQNMTRAEIPIGIKASSAFRNASAGGKHSIFLENSLDYTTKQLEKGIASFEKQISLHQEKIANPSKYIENWDALDPRQQKALINKKWPSDIERLTEQRDILHDVLKSKLSE